MIKIINPLYDVAFKYLMDNEQIAKIVLSIILDTKVISLQSKPQETVIAKDNQSNVFRYDFKAIIQQENGEHTAVLIELQKYKSQFPIERFREYLGNNYNKKETIIDHKGKEITASLPIITIYILGYNIIDEDVLAIKVDRAIKDIIFDRPIEKKSEFIELLTHTSIILQVDAKPKEKKDTRLERFITLFSQKLKNADPNYIIEIPDDVKQDDDLGSIVNYLNLGTQEEKIIRSLKHEEYHENSLKDLAAEAKEARKREEEARKREEEERKLKEDAIKREKEANNKLTKAIQRMYQKGLTIAEISENMGVSEADVRRWIGE